METYKSKTMSNSNDIEERLRQLEEELNFSSKQEPMKSADPSHTNFEQATDTAKSGVVGLVSWINGLTGVTKVAAIAAVGIFTFVIIKFLVNLVAAAISLVFMVGIIYVLYKLFFAPKPPAQI